MTVTGVKAPVWSSSLCLWLNEVVELELLKHLFELILCKVVVTRSMPTMSQPTKFSSAMVRLKWSLSISTLFAFGGELSSPCTVI